MTKGIVASPQLYSSLCSANTLTVEGLFSSAVYLSFADGELVMLHDGSYGAIPFGIAVDGLSGSARALGLDVGMELGVLNGSLSSPETSFALALEYRPEPEHAPTPMDERRLRELTGDIEAALERDGRSELRYYAGGLSAPPRRESFADPFARAGYEGVRRLDRAMLEKNAAELGPALEQLLGLGRGLTPSFDDFLCGAVYTFGRLSPGLPIAERLRAELYAIAPRRTNIYGAAYIRAAATGGEFSLLRAVLFSSPGAEREAAVAAMLAVGGSSGADMLCGMLWAANYILIHPGA